MLLRYLSVTGLLLLSAIGLRAQTTLYRPIATAMPSLRIAPDARSAALGEQGVATSSDNYAQYWNSSKYAFHHQSSGLALSYTPWLRSITEGVALMQVVGHYQLDKAKRHTLGASVRYFTVGSLTEWDALGQTLGEAHPYELALDLSYNYRLHRYWALGLTARFLHVDQGFSSRGSGQSAVAFDLSTYTERSHKLFGRVGQWQAGLALRNLGSKLSFDDGQTYAYQPTTLSLGAGLSTSLDSDNALGLSVQFDKVLVPLFPNADVYPDNRQLEEARRAYYDRNLFSSIVKSLSDAPDGFSEELKEIRWGIGLEYSYRQMFYLRSGYSYQHPDKGNLSALTLGAGLRWRSLTLDLSYLVGMGSYNAQDGTFRCSLAVDLSSLSTLFR